MLAKSLAASEGEHKRVRARLRRAMAPKGARVLARHPWRAKRAAHRNACEAFHVPCDRDVRLDAVKHAQTALACLLPLHCGICRRGRGPDHRVRPAMIPRPPECVGHEPTAAGRRSRPRTQDASGRRPSWAGIHCDYHPMRCRQANACARLCGAVHDRQNELHGKWIRRRRNSY